MLFQYPFSFFGSGFGDKFINISYHHGQNPGRKIFISFTKFFFPVICHIFCYSVYALPCKIVGFLHACLRNQQSRHSLWSACNNLLKKFIMGRFVNCSNGHPSLAIKIVLILFFIIHISPLNYNLLHIIISKEYYTTSKFLKYYLSRFCGKFYKSYPKLKPFLI